MFNFKRQVIKLGGVTMTAKCLGVTPQVITNWMARGISSSGTISLSNATGIPVWEIRPDLYPKSLFKKEA